MSLELVSDKFRFVNEHDWYKHTAYSEICILGSLVCMYRWVYMGVKSVCACVCVCACVPACIHDSFESILGHFCGKRVKGVCLQIWHHHLGTFCFQLGVSAVGYRCFSLLRKSRTPWPICWLQFCNGNNGNGVFIIKWFGKMHLGCTVGKTYSTLTTTLLEFLLGI